jgi:hypothetical protein
MDLHHLRQGLHVIASSWDYHGGAESRVSVRGNSVHFNTKEIIHYYSVECRIRHEFDLWTRSFRPAMEYAISKMTIRM